MQCAGQLGRRGVRLKVAVPEGNLMVRGTRDQLRQMLEHLLNNAAQAIARFRALQEDEGPPTIRINVGCDERALHVTVSDTGQGFKELARVFDPFYTTVRPAGGAGMGLSICSAVVHEHGGEISAFNLLPHGAAVIVKLSLAPTMQHDALPAGERVLM